MPAIWRGRSWGVLPHTLSEAGFLTHYGHWNSPVSDWPGTHSGLVRRSIEKVVGSNGNMSATRSLRSQRAPSLHGCQLLQRHPYYCRALQHARNPKLVGMAALGVTGHRMTPSRTSRPCVEVPDSSPFKFTHIPIPISRKKSLRYGWAAVPLNNARFALKHAAEQQATTGVMVVSVCATVLGWRASQGAPEQISRLPSAGCRRPCAVSITGTSDDQL